MRRRNAALPRRLWDRSLLCRHGQSRSITIRPFGHVQNNQPATTTDDLIAVKASILERQPQLRELRRLLKNLSERRHYNGQTTYFDAARLQAAMHDLSSEDPPLRIAILSTKSSNHASKVQQALMFSPSDLLQQDINPTLVQPHKFNPSGKPGEYLGPLITDPTAAQLTSGAADHATVISSVLSDKIHRYPLEIIASQPHSIEGTYNPLSPLLSLSPRTYYPVHRSFLIHSESQDVQESPLNEFEGGLVHHIIDMLPQDIIDATSNEPGWEKSSAPLRISSELAIEALSMLSKPDYDLEKMNKAWKMSRIEDLRNILEIISEKKENATSLVLRRYVRDSIAAILMTSLPNAIQEPSETLTDTTSGQKILRAVEDLMQAAETEISESMNDFYFHGKSINPLIACWKLSRAATYLEKRWLTQTEVNTSALLSRMKNFRGEYAMSSELFDSFKSPETSTSLQNNMLSAAQSPIANGSIDKPPSEAPVDAADEMTDFFKSTRRAARIIMRETNSQAWRSTREFLVSGSLVSAGVGLMAFGGYDAALVASLWSVMMIYLSQRWWRRMDKHILDHIKYLKQYSNPRIFSDMKDWLIAHAQADEKSLEAVARYNQQKQELEDAKFELQEARSILLKIDPTLKSRFPEWHQPPAIHHLSSRGSTTLPYSRSEGANPITVTKGPESRDERLDLSNTAR